MDLAWISLALSLSIKIIIKALKAEGMKWTREGVNGLSVMACENIQIKGAWIFWEKKIKNEKNRIKRRLKKKGRRGNEQADRRQNRRYGKMDE